jgi:hypothetical protein
MRVNHTRRAAIAVLSLLKADAFVRPGQVNALRLQRLLWAKTQLRRVETLPQRLGLVIAFLGLRLLALAEFLSTAPAIEPPIGEPTPRMSLGLDEHGRVEAIDMTPAGLEDPPAPRVLPAPSAAQTTKPKPRVKRPQGDRAAQLEAAKRLLAGGQSVRATARRLGVSESTLRGWRKRFMAGAIR